jgi:hypothetical protein
MCTTTVCVCRMKRTVFVIPDEKYGGSWGTPQRAGIKDRFYASYDLGYGALTVAGASAAAESSRKLVDAIAPLIAAMRREGVQDTWFLDRLHNELRAGLDALSALKISDIAAADADRDINLKTLMDLKRLCRLPA